MSPLVVVAAGLALCAAAWLFALRGNEAADRVAVAVVLALGATAFNVIVPVPNIEATTLVVVCLALTLGPASAILAGSVAVVGTSVTGGLGTWTAWQVTGYALVALTACAAGAARQPTRPGDRAFVTATIVAATVVYDFALTASSVTLLGGADARTWSEAVQAALLIGVPYTLTHVCGNALLGWFAAPTLLRALDRAARRLEAAAP